MRITDPGATRHGFLHAALKIVILSPTLCAAYAGRSGLAREAIRQASRECLEPEAVIELLTDAHRQSEGAADFLVATVQPSRLVVIKNDCVKAAESAWLGDANAFAGCQTSFRIC
jgi:hypothetical protein